MSEVKDLAGNELGYKYKSSKWGVFMITKDKWKIELNPISMTEWTKLFLTEQWTERELNILRNEQIKEAYEAYKAMHNANTAYEKRELGQMIYGDNPPNIFDTSKSRYGIMESYNPLDTKNLATSYSMSREEFREMLGLPKL